MFVSFKLWFNSVRLQTDSTIQKIEAGRIFRMSNAQGFIW